MSAHAKAFVLACIDPRFRCATETFIEKKFNLRHVQYDLKTDAGGVKEVALKSTTGEWIIANAEIAYHKHGARIFVICNHIGCSYYGGSESFHSLKEEQLVHVGDLRSAAEILRGRFQDIQIYAYIISKQEKPVERFIFRQVV